MEGHRDQQPGSRTVEDGATAMTSILPPHYRFNDRRDGGRDTEILRQEQGSRGREVNNPEEDDEVIQMREVEEIIEERIRNITQQWGFFPFRTQIPTAAYRDYGIELLITELPEPGAHPLPPLPPPPPPRIAIRISGEHISDNNSITSSCPICHVDFVSGEEGSQLSCGHIYHHVCISAWLICGDTCPVCRAEQ